MKPRTETFEITATLSGAARTNRQFYDGSSPARTLEGALGDTSLSLGCTVHRPTGTPSGVALFYFHGGAFVCGWRDDLPPVYIDMICAAGHTLVCIDYPFAPECAMVGAIVTSYQAVRLLSDELEERFGCSHYVLFGRSAGAYLSLMLSKRLAADSDAKQPLAIWDFYGYWDHTDPFFLTTSKYYAGLAAIKEAYAMAQLVDPCTPLTNGEARPQRVLLYAYGRQSNIWPAMLGIDESTAATYSLTQDELAKLPPLFITQSTGDQDVPYKQSKQLSRIAPHAKLHTVYYLEHDFDRLTDNPAGKEAYAAALAFLQQVISASLERNQP